MLDKGAVTLVMTDTRICPVPRDACAGVTRRSRGDFGLLLKVFRSVEKKRDRKQMTIKKEDDKKK
jgi:hypothetical protein